MKKITITSLALGFAFFVTLLLFAQQDKHDFYLLDDLKIENRVVKLTTSGTIKYNVFKISNPPRLVIELFNTEHNLKQKELTVNNGVIKRIRSGQFQNEPKIARVVVDLVKMTDYKATQKDNQISIEIIPEETQTAEKPKETEVPKTEQPALTQPAPTTASTPAHATVTTTAPTPVPAQKTKTSKKTTRVTSKKTTGVVLPKIPVTLEYVDADLTDVLQVMAIRSGINIIYGADVKGTITISLKNVPFDQAFNTILSLKGLTTIPVGDNVLRIITPAQLTLERAEGVTFTKVFPLNYATASEIKTQLDAVRTAEGRKGSVTIDERTNSLIVTDTQEGLASTEALIAKLDTKPLQVLIEAKLVDITLTDLLELGVNWSGKQVETVGGGGMTLKGGDVTAGPIEVTQPDVTGVKEVKGTGAELSGITMPGSGAIFSFGMLTDNLTLSAKLAALASQNKVKVLASPKVTTINNKEAKILIGEKVAYKTTTVTSGASPIVTETWEYVDAGVKLTVTPIINPDKVITLKVKPEVSVPAPAAPGAAPDVRSREADVTVMVKDNDTLVIGGLIREEDIRDIQKIPLLGDLPVLGYLFKYKKDSKTRTELVIFLTPKIVTD